MSKIGTSQSNIKEVSNKMNLKEIAVTMIVALVGVAIALRIDAVRKMIGLPPVSTV